MQANSGDPDQMRHSVASDLGLRYLPMSHMKDARHKHVWVKKCNYFAYLIRVAEIWEVDCCNNRPSESAQGSSDLSKFRNTKTF